MKEPSDAWECIGAVPVLPALDLQLAVAFYESRLGFRCVFRSREYAGLVRDAIELHLWHCTDRRIPHHTSCRINITGIDPLYEACEAHGIVHPTGALNTKPWGLREFTVVDPSGNSIVFAEPPEAA